MIIESSAVVQKYTLSGLHLLKEHNEPVVGRVKRYIPNSALVVELSDDIEGILPLNKFEDSENITLSRIISKVGSKICAYIEDIDTEDNVVLLDRAKLQNWYKRAVLDKLRVGTVFDTEVISVAPFGVFIDMGYGVQGLLRRNDISIARVEEASNLFQPDTEIKVVYKGKTSIGYEVSHKELLGTWQENVNDFSEGEVILGAIRDIKPYGAFIEIAPNLTGLADFVDNTVYGVGDSVIVYFKGVNVEKQKVKLRLIKRSATEYKPKYKYKVQNGVMEEWVYTPLGAKKEIKTSFKEKESDCAVSK